MRNIWRLVSATLIVALVAIYIPVPARAQAGGDNDRVYVLGAVNNPGDFEYKQGMDAKQAIELAGGLASSADPSGVILVRADGAKTALNAKAIMQGSEKIAIGPGDTIVAKPLPSSGVSITAVSQPTSGNASPPAAPGSVQVEGQVKAPGKYDLKPGMTAGEALAVAGGPAETADLPSAHITRGGKSIPADLGNPNAKVALQAGDVLTVPAFTASITGNVDQPGTYTLIPGKTDNLEGLFNQAGGATANADVKSIRVSSIQGTERATRTADGSSRTARQGIKLQSGDAVFVPELQQETRRRTNLSDVYQVTIILATLVSIFKH
jgi:protein involved in polysaccharide export with SLBB domain